jgi:pimeloyl-CoA synthetase
MARDDWKRALALGALAASGLAFGIRAAAADDSASMYEKYYEAIEIKTLCEDSGAPDKATMQKVSAFIVGQTKLSMTAGESLKAIENAKDEAKTMVKQSGCDDSAVQKMITLYHSTEAAAQ